MNVEINLDLRPCKTPLFTKFWKTAFSKLAAPVFSCASHTKKFTLEKKAPLKTYYLMTPTYLVPQLGQKNNAIPTVARQPQSSITPYTWYTRYVLSRSMALLLRKATRVSLLAASYSSLKSAAPRLIVSLLNFFTQAFSTPASSSRTSAIFRVLNHPFSFSAEDRERIASFRALLWNFPPVSVFRFSCLALSRLDTSALEERERERDSRTGRMTNDAREPVWFSFRAKLSVILKFSLCPMLMASRRHLLMLALI